MGESDIMATWTVGDGGDFASPEAAVAAFNGVDIADDLTFDQISDVVCSASMILSGLQPVGYKIRYTCSYNEAHLNDWQNWYKISVTGGGIFGLNSWSNGKLIWGTLEMDHFYLEDNRAGFGTIVDFVSSMQVVSWDFLNIGGYANVHDFLIDGKARGSMGFYFPVLPLVTTKIWNFKVWDTVKLAPAPLSTSAGIYLERSPGVNAVPAPVVENGTLYNSFLEMNTGMFVTARNIVSSNNSVEVGAADYITDAVAGNTIENCADTDGSIDAQFPGQNTNTKTGIVPADEFKSLDDTNSKFLFLNDGSLDVGGVAVPERGEAPLEVQFTDQTTYTTEGVLATGGTEPTLTDTDIEGLDIPNAEGFYSIGCHQGQIV